MTAFWIERRHGACGCSRPAGPRCSSWSACAGIAVSTWVRPPPAVGAGVGAIAVAGALVSRDLRRLALTAVALALSGALVGDAAERRAGAERPRAAARPRLRLRRVVVTGPVGRTAFAVRTPAEAVRFGATSIRERVLLELPPERAPPQGAVLELRARPVAPRGPETGFDERGWLARRGVHVVLRGDDGWRIVGRRGGIGGVGDRLRAHVEATLARGTDGGAAPPAHGHRPRRGLGHRQGAAGRLPGERPAAPARGLRPERRDRRGRRRRWRRASSGWAGSSARRSRSSSSSRTHSRSVGSRPSSGRPWRERSRRSRGSSRARATAGTRSRSVRWCSWRGCRGRRSSPVSSSPSPRSPRSSSCCRACPRVPDAYPVPRGFWDVLVVAGACGLVTAPIVWLHFGARRALDGARERRRRAGDAPADLAVARGCGRRARAAGRGDLARLARRLVRVVARVRRAGRRSAGRRRRSRRRRPS